LFSLRKTQNVDILRQKTAFEPQKLPKKELLKTKNTFLGHEKDVLRP
jgi:hypothetical protein